jgi:hypothetical protein
MYAMIIVTVMYVLTHSPGTVMADVHSVTVII